VIRSVLVPLDGSPFAEQALPLAATIARAFRTKLRLVTVHAPPAPPASPDQARTYAVLDVQLRRAERAYLVTQAERLRKEGPITVVTFVLDDPVAAAIAEHARGNGVALVVMTTHGRGALSRFWMGSVADELIRTLTIPVLLIRPREGMPAPLPVPDHRIVVPLDGSALGETALEPAAELAERMRLGLTLLQVVLPPALPGDDPMVFPVPLAAELLESKQRESEDYLASVARRLRARELMVDIAVKIGASVTDVILEMARAEDVALVAMSTHGRGGLQRLLLGSVADKVIRAGERPVLVTRAMGKGRSVQRSATAPARTRHRARAR
jgi:nucleotide-binding universal stress UspA family protein